MSPRTPRPRSVAAILCAVLLSSATLAASDPSPEQLEEGFKNPPASARPLTLWHWMNGVVTKEGITADLEAFKRVGLAGTQQFLGGSHMGGTDFALQFPEVEILNPKWKELFKHALTESARLGLDFGTHNSPGWSSSGYPTVTPAQSMQRIIFAETLFKGPGTFKQHLPTGKIARDYYGDIAVFAFQNQRLNGGRGNNAPLGAFDQQSLLDLTAKMDKDGTLTWDAPEGDWTIVRFGHTTTEKTNVAAPVAGTGLEVDKMSWEALDAFWKEYPEQLFGIAPDLLGKAFKRIEIDSYEAGEQTWTPRMFEEFQKRRGYDMRPYLPAFARRAILTKEGVDLAPRFMNDFNQTVAELFADNYYGYMKELVHKAHPGLQFMLEPYNTSNPSPIDTNNLAKVPDITMAEFWQRPSEWGWTSVRPVASGAHTWGNSLNRETGEQIVASEAFTGQPNYAWQSDPYLLKATTDRAFAMGVNKLVYHTSAQQPWTDPRLQPGMNMGWWGTHFGRTTTWWEHGAKEWITYQTRCQYLLQQGLFAADIAYLTYGRVPITPPHGYEGDNIGTEALLTRTAVKEGRIVLPDGMSYGVLVLPNRTTITPQLARKIRDLVNAGATLVGPKFTSSPSLENYPACDAEVAAIGNELWGDSDDAKAVMDRQVGKGRVFANLKPEEVLAKIGRAPDVELTDITPPPAQTQPATGLTPAHLARPVIWIHRATSTAEIYFLSNQTEAPVSFTADFRIAGKLPELWNAETDKPTLAEAPVWKSENGRTQIPFHLNPSGSTFVLFRKPAANANPITSLTLNGQPIASAAQFHAGTLALSRADRSTQSLTLPALPAPQDLSADWKISFQKLRGAPDQISLPKLQNLSAHETPGVKYFSGTATYAKSFTLSDNFLQPANAPQIQNQKSKIKNAFLLDLGTVKNVAEVKINGTALPLMWLPPFGADVTPYLKPGENRLEIAVTNTWINRLVGDEQYPSDLKWGKVDSMNINRVDIPMGRQLLELPDWLNDPSKRPSKDRVTFSTFNYFTKETPLPESGLIGPVTLKPAWTVDLAP